MNATIAVTRQRHVASIPRWMVALALALLLAGAVAYLAPSAYVVDKFSTAARLPVTDTPAAYGLSYQPVTFYSTADHVRLEGWFIDSPGSKVILLLHGWNQNRDEGGKALQVAKALVAHNYDVFMFDFRGHGQSGDGRMTLGQFETRDVAGALDYLKTRGVSEVGVIGWSLGANTAMNAAPEHPEMRAIVADSVWAELAPELEYQLTHYSGLPGFYSPGVMLMGRVLYGIDIPDNQPARALASLGNRPVLLIHGTADDLIPVSNAYLLQKAAVNDPNFDLWIAPGSGHANAYHDYLEEYARRVLAFFDKYLQ
jgi:uncharacterized protein